MSGAVLQFGTAGAPIIVSGRARPDATVFLIQNTENEANQIFNGQLVKPYDVAILPPASDFTFAFSEPHQWLSISVPVNLQKELAEPRFADLFPFETTHVFSMQSATRRLVSIALRQAHLSDEPTSGASGNVRILIEALSHAVQGRASREATSRVVRVERSISRALEFITTHSANTGLLRDLYEFAGVKERTFRRLFSAYFGMAPHHYLKYRQLNLVRRAIRLSSEQESITGILSSFGVTEFGRFAGEYRALFGENPSETLRTAPSQRRVTL